MSTKNFGHRSGILGPEENVALTQEQFDEYIRCVQDHIYFTENYVKIRQADGGDLVPFVLRDYQKQMMVNFDQHRFNICLCPRQSGKTETVVAFILHYVLFNRNKLVAILTNKEKLAMEILGRIKLAYQNLPLWLQQNVMNDNLTELVMGNGSRILASATSKDAIRGLPVSLLYLDEFAHIETGLADDFYTSVYPTVSSGKETKIIISSTPNGLNLFYKLWKDATDKKNNYVPMEVNWWETPGRDEKWKQSIIRDIGDTKFDQEYGNEFLGSSHTLISGKKLRTMAWTNPMQREDFDRFGNYSIYEQPVMPIVQDKKLVQEGHVYLISVDVSRGMGLDYSAFQVIDVTEIPYKQVAKFKHNEISPLVFPTHIVAAARHFNDAFILVEINDIGQQISDIIHNDLEYENLLKIQIKGKLGQQLMDSGAPTKTALGLKTSTATKKIGCANLKTLVEQDKLLICDGDTIMELGTFVAHKDTYKAASDKDHDDLTMCLVNAAWLFRQPFFRELTNGDMRRLLVQEAKLQEESLLPIPIFDDDGPEKRLIDNGTLWINVEPDEYRIDWNSGTQQDYEEFRRLVGYGPGTGWSGF